MNQIMMANPLNAFVQGMGQADTAGQFRNRRKVNELLSEYGTGAMGGQQNAIAALLGAGTAGLDAVNTLRGIGQEDDRISIAREELGMRTQALRQSAAEAARAAAAEGRAAEVEQETTALRGLLTQFEVARRSGDEGAFIMQNADAFQSLGIDPREAMDDPDTWFAGALALHDGMSEGVMGIADALVPQEADASTSYIATGDRAAELGLDPEASYNITSGPEGISAARIGGGGQNITVEAPSTGADQTEFDKVAGRQQAEFFNNIYTQGINAIGSVAQIDMLEGLLSDVNTPAGAEAALKSWLGNYGVETDGLDAIQAAESVINRLVPAQRQPGSGPMSDADLELFKRSLPRLINTREGNLVIARSLRGVARYQQQQSAIADRVLAGEISPQEGRQLLMELENPLEQFRGAGETTVGGGFQLPPDMQDRINRWASE